MQLAQKATANGALSVIEFSIRSLIALLITPMLVSGLGPALFGVWKVIERMMSYMLVADGRVTQGLQSLLAWNQARHDDDLNRQAVRNAIAIWLSFLPIGLMLGAAFIYFAPSVVHEMPGHSTEIRRTFAILVLMILLSGFSSIPIACLVGANKAYVKFIPAVVSYLVAAVLMWVSLKIGLGIVGLAGAQLAGSFVLAALVTWAANRSLAWYGMMKPSWEGSLRFLRFNSWYVAWTLINKVILSSDVVLLGYLLSMSAVSAYVITGFSAQLFATVAALLISACVPGFGAVIGDKQYERAATMKYELSEYSWFFVTVMSSIFLACNQHFVRLWVGETMYAGRVAEVLILILTVQIVFVRSYAFIIDVTLDVRSKVYIGGGSAILSVVLAVHWIPEYGVAGLCASFIMGRLPMSIAFPLIVHKKLQQPNCSVAPLGWKLLSFVVLAAFGYGVSLLFHPDDWAEWVAMTMGAGMLIVPCAFFMVLGSVGRENALKRIFTIYNDTKFRLGNHTQ